LDNIAIIGGGASGENFSFATLKKYFS